MRFFTFKAILKFGQWRPVSPRLRFGIEHASTKRRVCVVVGEVRGFFVRDRVVFIERTARALPIVNGIVQDFVDVERFRIEALTSSHDPAEYRRANLRLSAARWLALENMVLEAIAKKQRQNTNIPGLNVLVVD